MTKRLFYTCPIKALYMMQEFGVEFEAEEDGEFYDFREWGVNSETINELLDDFGKYYPEKIYVKKESESIFKPKDRDVSVDLKGFQPEVFSYEIPSILYPKGAWTLGHRMRGADRLATKFRDGKHFFAPENES